MESSILDSLGVEIVGVMSPVSICMLLVVLLVPAISPPPPSSSSSSSSAGAAAAAAQPPPPVTAATLVYQESPSDSPAAKLEGSLLNAAAFVVLVAAATFVLVALYYYRFTGFLRGYMRVSAFFILASMGGAILFTLLRHFELPVDAVTVLLLLFNFSAVGVLSLFSSAVPILLRQAYTVLLGVIVAAWFTRLPEWTTWSVLLALAVYDLVAVLSPRGPLRILVELAASRDDDLPALVYEARPTIPASSAAARPPPLALATASASVELQPMEPSPQQSHPPDQDSDRSPNTHLANRAENPDSGHAVIEIENLEDERWPLVSNETSGGRSSDGRRPDGRDQPSSSPSSPGIEMFETTRGIRLGLGDFVFYSVLVGRAAMYDLMTVYACYLAIISGLGCTLILLSVRRHALPALPISIALGFGFYFLTRLLMEPFVVGASTNLVMF